MPVAPMVLKVPWAMMKFNLIISSKLYKRRDYLAYQGSTFSPQLIQSDGNSHSPPGKPGTCSEPYKIQFTPSKAFCHFRHAPGTGQRRRVRSQPALIERLNRGDGARVCRTGHAGGLRKVGWRYPFPPATSRMVPKVAKPATRVRRRSRGIWTANRMS